MAEKRQDSNRGSFEPRGQQVGAWWRSHDAQQASSSFRDQEDEACRRHYQMTHARGGSTASPASSPGLDPQGVDPAQSDYEQVRPLYQFGYLAGENPEYRDRPFEQVEMALQEAWNEAGRERYGDWERVRGPVGFGYSMRQEESGGDAPTSQSTPEKGQSTGHLEMDVPLELGRGPAKQHGDALREGNGNRHGLHERSERPNL